MSKLILKATSRKILGRKVKSLRKEGLLPANIYGKKVKSNAITVATKEFAEVFKNAGETSLIDLEVGKAKSAVLIRNVQRHPIEGTILHIDFQAVDLKEKVTADVPVVLVGDSPAEKQSLGTVVQYLDSIEVEALPGDLPENFTIDKSTLTDVDQNILVKDLKVDKAKVEILTSLDETVVAVAPPVKEEEVVVAPAEGEVVEGEKPTEGGEAPVSEAGTEEAPKAEKTTP